MIMIILVTGISLGLLAFSFNENDEPNISESIKSPIYIPSNITNANPNIFVGSGSSSWKTTNISDISDDILFTIIGTVLEVGNPINIVIVEGTVFGQGLIPVTITVDEVYKGQLNSPTFTFYLTSIFPLQNDSSTQNSIMTTNERISSILHDTNKKYFLLPESGQFEIGEKVLVHISEVSTREPYMIDDLQNFEQIRSHYSLSLGEYSKYEILDGMGYNKKFPTGITLDFVINESQ